MLADLVAILLRRRWLIVIPMAVIFLIPSVAGLTLAKSYVSEGSIEVEPNDVLTPVVSEIERVTVLEDPVEPLLDDAKQVLISRNFLEQIARRAGAGAELDADPEGTVETFRKNYEVFAAAPRLMVVRFRAATAERAQAGASAAMELILGERRRRAAANAQAAVDFFEKEVDALHGHVLDATTALRRFKERYPEAELSDSNRVVLNQLATLRAQLAQVRIRLATSPKDKELRTRETRLLDDINERSISVGATPEIELRLLRLEEERQEAQISEKAGIQQLDESRVLARVRQQRVSQDTVLDVASLPGSASRGKAITLAALAFIVAVAVAGSLVIAAEMMDTGVRRRADVEESTGLPILAVVRR